jgi:hypothetical protein
MSTNELSALTNWFSIMRAKALGRSERRISASHASVCHGAIGSRCHAKSIPSPARKLGLISGNAMPRL